MGDGFIPGAGGVEVGAQIRGEDAEGGGGVAFRGEVDVRASEGGGGGEEDGLGEGPGLEVWGQGGVVLDHLFGIWFLVFGFWVSS